MCFAIATVSKPMYTHYRVADKTYTVIQETGLYVTVCLQWNVSVGNR
jgi:hypothetical protein